MNRLAVKQVVALLLRVVNNTIQSFFYFPDTILVGKRRLEKDEFDFLLSENFIEEYKTDSFGKFYRLSPKAEKFIAASLSSRYSTHRKKIPAAYVQTAFCFSL